MNRKLLVFLLFLVFMVFIWSGIHPRDRFTWFLEVLPVLIGLSILAATYRRFKFTGLIYLFIAAHMILLMVGGHYTYAQVPLFNWIRDTFDLTRNHYDRVGHFAQGFVPALIAREILLRLSPFRKGPGLFFMVLSICLSVSAFYELLEWWVAVATGTAAEAFLGTQGDVWDTQWDMFLALCGAVAALTLFSKLHDWHLDRIKIKD
ncbi:DUF2238 domain-containing protein [Desulforamulus ruminis]|uniref:DUF2238 domain-containing protein n=1 Tax=Desulforamulus ruminis TaxID=1564 RepID=UPI002353F736|nr:DUF2238 domain-containing protein [Desulforamulus ruminis]